jgi:catechol 2,3-dioxygenase-like lactoylglutathione lyase family enzyme
VFDHVAVHCADVGVSAAFYDAVLGPLEGKRVGQEPGGAIGYGIPDKPGSFWIGPRTTDDGFRETHVAFAAPDRATVSAFFVAALAVGAAVLHEPRLWPEYHDDYFAAFVRDPDGNNIEAVCHLPL